MQRRLTTPFSAFVAVGLAAASATCQTAWTLETPGNAPPAFTAHAMSYHTATDTTVLFGGLAGGVRFDTTWLWNGTDWTQASPATVPTARVAHCIEQDLGRARLVMFGGLSDTSATLADTWEWDGVDWIQVSTPNVPPGRWAYCMCYHPLRGTIMIFGGFNNGNRNDFWEYDGTDWTQIATNTSPSTRRATAMAWDPVTTNVILFSGYQQAADTWMFDGVDWQQLTPATTPPARYDHAMATDLSRNRIVMFGDLSVGDTWEWDGTNWIDRTNANPPAPRIDTYLAYDWVRETVWMFGSNGAAETWGYAPTNPASFNVLGGTGCPGTSGLPPVLQSSDRPWLGETFEVQIGQVPNNGIGLMISGLSDTTSSIGPLPASLASIGMPGCDLLVDPVLIDVVLASGTVATWSLAIPNDPTLLGQSIYSQCGAVDLGVNAANLTVGNYGRATIGGK